jgi:hypothetical protein
MYLKLKLELSLFILPPDQRGQFDPDYPIGYSGDTDPCSGDIDPLIRSQFLKNR